MDQALLIVGLLFALIGLLVVVLGFVLGWFEKSGNVAGVSGDATNNDILKALETVADTAIQANVSAQSALDTALSAKEDSQDNSLQLFSIETKANQAIADASTADSKAVNAQADATSALNDASQAGAVAATAQSDALQALSDASQAGSAAATAQSDATQALSDASQAGSAAATAQSDATQALSDASQAGVAASTAQSDATQALSDAAQAGSDATTALAEINREADYFSATYSGTLTKTSSDVVDSKLPPFQNVDTNMTTSGNNKLVLNEGKRYRITQTVVADWPLDNPHNTYLNVYLRAGSGGTNIPGFLLFSKDSYYKYAGGQQMSVTALKDTTGLSLAARTYEMVFAMEYTTTTGNSISLKLGTGLTVTEVK